ncbi:hypothetical protein ST201phi2-1p430 [Pseudomonas phage 201phi2-1]|uniref:Uncharacterized protein n=1 Tax=Pseudomonas phage 201phi2-1 TaxID=198110 RepID=B3FJT8_BP201|nr:hypothetical protein ST201phi2-1p430 [Pseudomonas phage 201phi2-1]ABY63253.1 hypothetical protein 201phi2-1p430 [Pseudomonas phage 201phi2-1]
MKTKLIQLWKDLKSFKIERLVNKPGNEMWRIGGGYHDYRKYFRIDLGSRGYRVVRDFDYCDDYFKRVFSKCTQDDQNTLDLYMTQLMKEAQDNPELYPSSNKVRGGGMVVRERDDLFPKLWAKGKELQRVVRMA